MVTRYRWTRPKLLLVDRCASSLRDIVHMLAIFEVRLEIVDSVLRTCVVESAGAVQAPNPWQKISFVVRW